MAAPGMAELGFPDPQDKIDAAYMFYLTFCAAVREGKHPSIVTTAERLGGYDGRWTAENGMSYSALHDRDLFEGIR